MMIQSIMLVTLGFLAASLLALILAPALWKRAVRLTTDRIRIGMPIKLSEIHADKDQLRAEFAIKLRKYEAELEKANTAAAKQLVEISRRDAEIKSLEAKIADISSKLEEQQNANRVYEQTIALRIPKMEAQLHKAKEILGARYQEITQLRTTLTAQKGKLGQAQTLDQMRQAEMERLKLALDHSVESENLDESGKFVSYFKYKQVLSTNKELEEEIAKLRMKIERTDEKSVKKPQIFKSDIKSFAERIASMSGTPEVNGEDVAEVTEDTGDEEIADHSTLNSESSVSAEDGEAVIADYERAQSHGSATGLDATLINNDPFVEEVSDIGEAARRELENKGAEVLEMTSDEALGDAQSSSEDTDESLDSAQGSSGFMDRFRSKSRKSDADEDRANLKSERPNLKNLRLSDRLKILQGSN